MYKGNMYTYIYSYVKFVYRGTVFETLKGVSVRYFMISQTGSERFYNKLLFWRKQLIFSLHIRIYLKFLSNLIFRDLVS